MSSHLTMAREGSLIAFEGVSLSWPQGGTREVIDLPEGQRGPRLKRAVFEGKVIETDLPVTSSASGPTPRLLQGEEARRHFEEPAGPTVVVVSQKAEDELDTVETEEVEAVVPVREAAPAPRKTPTRGRPRKTT